MVQASTSAAELLGQPVTFPACQLKCPNRLAKAAMEELLSTLGGGDPRSYHRKVYSEWAAGKFGLVITGNVMVSPKHLGTPFDIIVPDPDSPSYAKSIEAWKAWAVSSRKGNEETPVIVQLCHTGRQSARGSGRGLTEPAHAPSAVPVKLPGQSVLAKAVNHAIFPEPKAMSEQDIEDTIKSFVKGARVAKDAGFQGVQLHASHGYLLAQFLSPDVNVRTDSYGGSAKNRMKIVLRIIEEIRKEFPASTGFCLSIKLNSSDYVQGGLTEEDALDNVRWLSEVGGLDFIEISGGTYMNPKMLGEAEQDSISINKPSERTKAREAFFINFANRAKDLLASLDPSTLPTGKPVIMVTGGFRTRSGMAEAVREGAADLIGLGRPACADPRIPLKLLDPTISDDEARSPPYKIRGTALLKFLPIHLIGPGLSTLWHSMLLHQVSMDQKPDLQLNFGAGFFKLWIAPLFTKVWVLVSVLLAVVIGTRSKWQAS